ncbi:hypothetical protein D3C73_870520 [compost metagenome]
MRAGVEVDHRAQDQQRHRAVQHVQRVHQAVEEEDVAQAQHQAGHGHGHQGQHAYRGAQAASHRAARRHLFHHPGAHEHHGRTDQGGPQRQLQAVAPGEPAAPVHVVEVVGTQRHRQVVRPHLHKRGPDSHADDQQQERGQHPGQRQERGIAASVGARRVRLGAAAHLRSLAGTQPAVQHKGQQGGQQQQDADGRALGKVLLPDHRLVGFHGQHVIVAAHHFGDAEIGDGQREHHAAGREHGIARAGQGHGQEGAPRARAHGPRRVVQSSVGQRQAGQQDHQRMRKRVEGLAHHNAPEAVDGGAARQALEQALVAQQIDQRNAGQQRRRQQGQQGNGAQHSPARQAGAGQAVGEAIGARHHQQHRHHAHGQAAPDHGKKAIRADDAGDHRQAGPGAFAVGHGLGQDGQQRQRQEQHQKQHQRALPRRQAQRADPGGHGTPAQSGHGRRGGGRRGGGQFGHGG